MKKLFSIVLFAFVANCVAFAWNGDGGLANPVRVWSNPVIYSYDEEVTWYYDFADADPAQLEVSTLVLWVWQPSNIADPGPYGNEPKYASETDGSPVAPSLPDVNKKLILKHCGGTVYSITFTPTEFFGKTEEEIVANTEGGFWQHIRLFDADGHCITNCGSYPILFPHQILLGTQGLASAA
ncbi:hypothetical protein LJC35_07420, partial [Parabacteroides sp. OttesenSCG-928-N08]|nr:hypothetical protein [Parabacteroides sp. OttesenSCG-928-N08]